VLSRWQVVNNREMLRNEQSSSKANSRLNDIRKNVGFRNSNNAKGVSR
jgi:hypothetical protein